MKFLYPELLFGWVALIIPVLIHLFNFRRFQKVYFTKVSYLKNIQEQTAAFQKIKNLLLLFSRLLVVFFLVVAFAQPYIPTSQNLNEPREEVVSIYIDNSFSMDLQNQEGDLLNQAKNRALEIVNAYGINTKYQLLTNNFDGKQQNLLSKQVFIDALNEVKICGFNQKYHRVLKRQLSALSEIQNSRKDVYLISDFQKQKETDEINLKDNFHLHLIPLKASYLNNISIDTAYFLSGIHQPNGAEKLVVKISNHGDNAVKSIRLQLIINKHQKAFNNVNIAPNKTFTDTLEFSNSETGWQRAILNLKDNPMVFDDTLRFSYEVKSSMEILCLYETQPDRFINAAYASDDFFALKSISEKEIDYITLQNYPLIIVSNLTSVAPGLGQQLIKYIKNGGYVAVFIPLKADIKSYQNWLQSFPVDYPLQINNQYLSAGKLAITHPFFNGVFDEFPKNIDLPNASKSWEFSHETDVKRQGLLYSQSNLNWFTYYPLSAGGIYLSALPLEPDYSNFTQHALFLPILFRMALLSTREQSLYQTIGEKSEIPLLSQSKVSENLLKLSNMYSSFIAEPSIGFSGYVVNFADQVKNADFYQLKQKDSLLATIAFNYNREESNLQFFKKAELKEIFNEQKPEIYQENGAALKAKIKVSALGTTLWKVCLILALLFLLIEILLIRFYKPKI